MPDIFLPELVSPAIRFMYNGRLELKNHNVVKLKETANALGEYLLRVQACKYLLLSWPISFNKAKTVFAQLAEVP